MGNSIDSQGTTGNRSVWDGPLALFVLVAAILAVYWNALPAPFHLDDFERIVEDASIHRLWPVGGTPSRPVLSLSLALNYAMSGAEPLPFRATNVLIHIVASLFLLGVLRRTLKAPQLRDICGESASAIAFAIALAWAVHPIHTQAVTYIWQRGESMMGMFFLGTVYCVVRHSMGGKVWRWSLAAFVLFIMGLGTKEVMIAALPVLVVFDGLLLSPSAKEALRRRRSLYLAMASVTGVGVVTMLAWTVTSLGKVSSWRYALSQPGVMLEYLRLAVFPYPQSFDYGREPAYGFVATVLPGAAISFLLVGTLWALRKRAWYGVAGVWFFMILAPTSSVVPINDLMVEYRMYLPLVPVIALAFASCWKLFQRKGWPIWPPTVVLVLALGSRTVIRNQVFESNQALWQSVTEASPANGRGHDMYGLWLALDGQLEEALEQGRLAVELDPSSWVARWNYATSLVRVGKLEEGLEHYQIVLKENTHDGWRYAAKGEALLGLGRYSYAVQAYRRAITMEPKVAGHHQGLASSLGKLGKRRKALRASRVALELDPNLARMWLLRSRIALDLGKDVEGLRALKKAVRLTPENKQLLVELIQVQVEQGDYADALVMMERAMTSTPSIIFELSSQALGIAGKSTGPADLALALQLGELAAEKCHRRDPRVLANLGRILVKIGKPKQGLAVFDELLALPGLREDAAALAGFAAERSSYAKNL